jgi:PBSX family phage terminase large subunit
VTVDIKSLERHYPEPKPQNRDVPNQRSLRPDQQRKHVYKPRGSCLAVFGIQHDEVLIAGPAGTGKSRACLEKLHFMAMLNPGMRGLMVRKTLVSLATTALVTWREQVILEALANSDVEYYGGSSQEPPQYRYRNGSVIVIGGMDKATRIMSSEYDAVYVQEATELTEDDWEMITTRLRNWVVPFQQIIADCNPDVPHHWLKLRADSGKTKMLYGKHTDNPKLFDDDGEVTPGGAAYLDKLRNLTGVRRLRLLDGIWVAAEGVIYDEWDPEVHYVKPFKIPADWTRWWTVDFGYVNPFVCQMWAEDPDGRIYLYREVYFTQRTVDEHARSVLQHVTEGIPNYKHPEGEKRFAYHGRRWREPKPRAILCDHDAEGRVVFERETGLVTQAAVKVVNDGIDAVKVRLKSQRLFIMQGALVERDPELGDNFRPTCTVEEIVGYVWDTGQGKIIKDVPLKENDHGMDAMRYLVTDLDLKGRPRVRWIS